MWVSKRPADWHFVWVGRETILLILADSPVTDWVHKTWTPILGYAPEILYLTKGWMGFICKTPEDVTILLDRFWVLGGSTLMLKRWRVAFDPLTEHFQHRHFWVLLSGLPIAFLERGGLKAIGNALGRFISLDTMTLTKFNKESG
jgi:hypothetical protein